MNEIENREQLSNIDSSLNDLNSVNIENDEKELSFNFDVDNLQKDNVLESDKDNSNFDFDINTTKFKDVESLFKAYNELEKEFTKKSQALSELKKDKEKLNNLVPCYEKDMWKEDVQKFLNKYPNAINYAKEITETILKNKDIANLPNPLDYTYNLILASKYKSYDNLISDEEFLSKIINDRSIQEKIIKNYMVNIKNSPPLIFNDVGSLAENPNRPAKNLEDAKKVVESLFHIK